MINLHMNTSIHLKMNYAKQSIASFVKDQIANQETKQLTTQIRIIAITYLVGLTTVSVPNIRSMSIIRIQIILLAEYNKQNWFIFMAVVRRAIINCWQLLGILIFQEQYGQINYLYSKQIQQMKSRSGSQPALRQVYSSRIKDGRRSNDEPPLQNNYMSPQKMGGVYNPQSPRAKVKEQCYHNKQSYSPNPKDKQDFMKTQAESPVKRIADFEPPKITKFQNRKQETYNGRKLEYPHHSYKNAGYYPQQAQPKQQAKLQRSQSARPHSAGGASNSKHYVDRTAKSRQIKQKQIVDDEKIRVAVNYLFENNEDYLGERARVCRMKARPKQQIFKIDLAKTLTTYKDHYPPKQAKYQFHIQPQNQKTALSLGPRKVCGNSTTHQFHDGTQGPKADLANWPDGFKLQGPLDGTTTYANKFPNYGDYQKMVPIAVFNEHPMGMPFKTISTHTDHFRGEPYPKADLATWNNMHPYGNHFDPNRSTTYRSHHNRKQKQPIQQWPMYDPRLITSKGKFSTQYKSQMKKFNQHQLNHGNYCQCDWHRGRSGRKRIYN